MIMVVENKNITVKIPYDMYGIFYIWSAGEWIEHPNQAFQGLHLTARLPAQRALSIGLFHIFKNSFDTINILNILQV